GQDVERPVVLTRHHRLAARRIVRSDDVGGSVTGAEVSLLRIRFHVDAGSTYANGRVLGRHMYGPSAREHRQDLPGQQLGSGYDHRIGLPCLERHLSLAALEEGTLAHDVDDLAVLSGLDG